MSKTKKSKFKSHNKVSKPKLKPISHSKDVLTPYEMNNNPLKASSVQSSTIKTHHSRSKIILKTNSKVSDNEKMAKEMPWIIQ